MRVAWSCVSLSHIATAPSVQFGLLYNTKSSSEPHAGLLVSVIVWPPKVAKNVLETEKLTSSIFRNHARYSYG